MALAWSATSWSSSMHSFCKKALRWLNASTCAWRSAIVDAAAAAVADATSEDERPGAPVLGPSPVDCSIGPWTEDV